MDSGLMNAWLSVNRYKLSIFVNRIVKYFTGCSASSGNFMCSICQHQSRSFHESTIQFRYFDVRPLCVDEDHFCYPGLSSMGLCVSVNI